MNLDVSVHRQVRDDLFSREQLGIRRYGKPLLPFNGRNALVDAYQEVLDLACYLRQQLIEMGVNEIHDQPTPKPLADTLEPPEQRAARFHADDECGDHCRHTRLSEGHGS